MLVRYRVLRPRSTAGDLMFARPRGKSEGVLALAADRPTEVLKITVRRNSESRLQTVITPGEVAQHYRRCEFRVEENGARVA